MTTTVPGYQTLLDRLDTSPTMLKRACEQCADIIHRAMTDRPVTDPEAATLAAGMNASLAVRDALLTAALGTPDEATVLLMTTSPNDPDAAHALATILDAAFNRADRTPDPWRVRNALGLCDRCGILAGDQPQTHAAAAYLHWAEGQDRRASRQASIALRTDDQCTLARLVIAGLLQGVHPARLAR